MSPLSELNQKRIYRLIWLLSGILMLIIVWMWVQPLFTIDDKNVVEAVEMQLKESFLDDAQTLINPQVTGEQMNRLVKDANQLKSLETTELQQKTKHLVEQYNDLQTTALLFNVKNHHDINWSSKKYPKVAPGVTSEKVKQIQETLKHRATPQFQEWVQGATEFVQEVVEGHEALEEGISHLDQSSISSQLDTLHLVSKHWWVLEHFDEDDLIKLEAEEKLSPLSDEIVELYEEGQLKEEELTTLFEIAPIADKLSGTPMDPRLLASLTFDDGPHPEVTPQVLDVLDQYNIKATFFVMGGWVEKYPEVAKQVVDQGHIIANHTYTHPDLSAEKDESVYRQLQWGTETIEEATGVTPTLFRMPFGSGGPRVVNIAKELGLTSIIWNVDSADWMLDNGQDIYERVMRNLEPKSLILMHDTSQKTVDAIKLLIPELISRGYHFVDPTQVGFNERYFEDR